MNVCKIECMRLDLFSLIKKEKRIEEVNLGTMLLHFLTDKFSTHLTIVTNIVLNENRDKSLFKKVYKKVLNIINPYCI